MAPEIEKTRAALPETKFGLLLGGIGLDNTRAISDQAKAHLQSLWQRVSATTGQQFSGQLPADGFVYNSLLAGSAIFAMRGLNGPDVFKYLYSLQRRFFLQGQDINHPMVQTEAAEEIGVDALSFTEALRTVDQAEVIQECQRMKDYGSQALPSVFVEVDEPERPLRLIAGGYVTAEFLIKNITHHLTL